MYAIIESGSKQYKVAVGDTIQVDRLSADEGSELSIDRVLLVGGTDSPQVGTPVVSGASVTATVKQHLLGEKRLTYKYSPRQRTRRKVGFRPSLTTLEITAING